MYVTNSTLQLLHEDRLRDAANPHAHLYLIRDVNEQAPNIVHRDLLQQIKLWMRRSNRAQTQPQEANDVRRIPAI